MFGWKKKYKKLEEQFEILKKDFNDYKKNTNVTNEKFKQLVSENKKLVKGYTSLLKLYGVRHNSFSIPYTVHLYDKYNSSYYVEPNIVEFVIPQIRFIADESILSEAGISLDEE